MTQFQRGRDWLAQRPYVIAIFISVVLVLWMASGVMHAQEIPDTKISHQQIIPKVKVETLVAENINNVVQLYGRTEPDRVSTIKAEISGKIEQVFAKRGARVKQGDIIAKIAVNDIEAQLARSRASLKQKEIEYKGAQKLAKDGYQGEAQLTSAQANLMSVKAEIKRLELMLMNTTIVAPFDGVLNTRYVEQGDYVKNGDKIAMVADLDPLVVRAYVTENQVQHIKVGHTADAKILQQGVKTGEVRYLASVADEQTNTFKIEVKIDNANYQLLAGLSSEVEIPLTQVPAIKITPALLALDESGNIGVKTVTDNIVNFTAINIVKTESDGIWLSGLGEQANVITLGQGFVRAGDLVEPVYPNAIATK